MKKQYLQSHSDFFLCVVRHAVPASGLYYGGRTAGQNTAADFSTTHCFSVGKGCGAPLGCQF